jgi:hypothetical protein
MAPEGTDLPVAPDEATEEPPDEADLLVGASEWLAYGLLSTPADRSEAEAGVREAYELGGLAAPARVLWCASPLAGARLVRQLTGEGSTGASVRAAVRTRPWASARADLTERLGQLGWARHWLATAQQNWQLLTERVVNPMRARLETELGDDRLMLLDAVHGQHDAAWLGAFSDLPALSGLVRVARTAGWWWPYEQVAVLTERPVAVHRDNLGRLHQGDGPALAYPDGWSLFAWRGMPIPPEVAAELPTLTVERIRAERNAEVRRVMLEHFGFDRYLRDSDATRVHSDECGVLWRVRIPDDEPLTMVEVVNATPEPDGSRRTYFLRVPPATQTAREGVAWTFGLDEDRYQPLAQT